MTLAKFYEKLDEFLKLVERERNAAVEKRHPVLHQLAVKEGRRGYEHFDFEDGQKFVRIVTHNGRQGSVHTFVEKATGIIWGAAGYKQRNNKRWYGTLDTMHEWDWSGYYGVPKDGRDAETATLVPKSERR